MRTLIVFLISLATVIYFNTPTNAMMLVNSEKVYPVLDDFIIDIDIDCDYDPDTGEVSNCKVVSKSDE